MSATDTHRHAGRVLYVNGGASHLPLPMRDARRITLSPPERAAAKEHIEKHGRARADRVAIEEWFREHAAQVFAPEGPPAADDASAGAPYRTVAVNLRTCVLEVVPDPFPSRPRARILVIDEDTDTADSLRRSHDFEVTHVDEGWAAVEAVERTEYDAIVCALRVGAMSGASLHRLIAKSRPAVAGRMVFVAAPHVVASAPPSSALGRVLARPVRAEHIRALLA